MNECEYSAGEYIPIVNFSKCEAKGPCIEVCPYDVFELRKIEEKDYNSLTLAGRLKTLVHGKDKAYATRANRCHGCGYCVKACPEKAIQLIKA
ncbi:MAG TPA: 4Fe-4S binding protein [Leptospiraceae bacterium]|nr:4Fe-4S binding protein [Leptospiraceae bacterium]HMW06498.1 4Fe-4S binding protein [Leptospiraceae bacterium]HMX33239.1 4Fe-4S binding protein [Leptospiraceae bacterium]HMY32864.1 4Fe-4S binding protein [Leptospiraceae bacterium]HMZ66085.1 4Fe-4S binding protein [Leptospiraceae bacterium]